ncbi:MAG: twin-arginine translocation signal domain-containing protein, partial [Sulfuricaulis sp.]
MSDESSKDGKNTKGAARRRFIKAAGVAGLTASVGPFIITRPARAARKTLKILQWNHFVPAYDKWFDN